MSNLFPYIHIPVYKIAPNFIVEAFGLLVAFGVILGAWLARRRAERLNLDVNLLIDSFFVVIPGGFVLAHWASLFLYFPERVVSDPIQIIYFWAGISSFGGILGGLLVAWLFFRAKTKTPYPYLETMAYGLIPGFTMGRLGCTVAHDHAGQWVASDPARPLLIGTGKGGATLLPSYADPKLWIFVAVLALTAMLVVSLWREKPLFHKSTLGVGLVTALLFVFAYPAAPEIIRSLGIPWPVAKAFTANPSEFSPMLLWADTNALVQGKQVLLKTRLLYDLGLIEFLFYVFFICAMAALMAGPPRREGTLLAFWFITYAPARFLFDYLRIWDRRYLGLTPGQYLCIAMFAIGVYIYATLPNERWGASPPKAKETA